MCATIVRCVRLRSRLLQNSHASKSHVHLVVGTAPSSDVSSWRACSPSLPHVCPVDAGSPLSENGPRETRGLRPARTALRSSSAEVPSPKPRGRRGPLVEVEATPSSSIKTGERARRLICGFVTAPNGIVASQAALCRLQSSLAQPSFLPLLPVFSVRLFTNSASAGIELSQELSLVNCEHRRKMRNEIYCQGTLLAAVQTARLFVDCKHFVDMPLKHDAETTLTCWNQLISEAENGQIEPAALAAFVQEHFEQPGGELEDFEPLDFKADAGNFANINDAAYRSWALDLHRKWPTLCRRISEKVTSDPLRYSIIPLPNPFVVPGGRFREMYYWDSFFTIKGLLASQMYGTVRGMIENMGHLIETFGYVPNGNRIYYLNRSQPPLLTWCVDAYFQHTGDLEFVRRAMGWLEKEMEFFTKHRTIHKVDWKAFLFRYHVVATGPRPESYREDVECAEHIVDAPEKLRLWGDIMAAAESGRDFSARWFLNDGPMAGKMGSTRTSSILPVDLNSIICGNYRIFARFYALLGMPEEAAKAEAQFQLMREAIHQVFWNESLGCWFDYDLVLEQHVSTYYDTNFFPMFAGCVHHDFDPHKVASYLDNAGVLKFPGGLPTSLIASGQQWDFPNAWAPTTWVIIEGFRKNGMPELAKSIAEKWIRKNYDMWSNTGGRMFEKYNVASQCYKAVGGGGEYELQEGFGWTNGVILDLLLTYANELVWEQQSPASIDCTCCLPSLTTTTTTTPPQDAFLHCGIAEPQPLVVGCGVLQKA